MKNQYFGDVNDYLKYGLIRSILRSGSFSPLIAWMLTPDDGSSHGQRTEYLGQERKWSAHDSELYHGLQTLMGEMFHRSVSVIEQTNLIENATYLSSLVPDDKEGRSKWASDLYQASEKCDFVFLDPDIGIEVPSKGYGLKNSSQYIYWRELSALCDAGKSLLIYQHFRRENRTTFIQHQLGELKTYSNGCKVNAFSTANVVFLLALQPEHSHWQPKIVKDIEERWGEQIGHWELHNAGLET